MPAMSAGGFVRSVHHKLFVAPVTRAITNEMENASIRLSVTVDEASRDLRRILGDIVDANDEVAESIGRNLVRRSAELDALREQLVGLDRRMATLDERP